MMMGIPRVSTNSAGSPTNVPEKSRPRVFLNVHLADGLEYIRRIGAPGALGRAIVALMAKPDIRGR